MSQLLKVLLVGVYSPDIIMEATGLMLGRPIDWTVVGDAPSAYLAVFGENGGDFAAIVIDSQVRGLAPTAECFIAEVKKSYPQTSCVAVAYEPEECVSLRRAGCDSWCDFKQLPACIRSVLVLAGTQPRIAS